jgi:hypothetical protein
LNCEKREERRELRTGKILFVPVSYLAITATIISKIRYRETEMQRGKMTVVFGTALVAAGALICPAADGCLSSAQRCSLQVSFKSPARRLSPNNTKK